MKFQLTTSTKKIAKLQKRIRVIQGGTSASKSISILLLLVNQAQRDTSPTVTSIVSESFPHLRRGVMRDFLNIMQGHNYYKEANWDKTNSIYTFETGSQIEFFSADQSEKMRGARRDRLFINECNNVTLEAFNELEVRTKEVVFLDFNPTSEFWLFTEVVGKRDDIDLIIVTYKDNEALDAQIVASIEQRKNNRNWWRVYGEGLLGDVEGKVYKDWKIIDEIPHEARLISYGLDFGYTNDPTSIVAIYYFNGGYIFDEVCYQKGLSNKQIADIFNTQSKAIIMADSAEPKSIDELRVHGLTVLASTKGKGSVSQGIQFVQAQRISVTKSSINVIREYRNYLWETDKDGKVINVPEHEYSHSLDAIRYGMQVKMNLNKPKEYQQLPYESPSPFTEQVSILDTLSTPKPFTPNRVPLDVQQNTYEQPDYNA